MIRHRLAFAAVLALTTLSLHAQLLESEAGVRLHFDDPGARAVAMGGASVALSNEWATNPASLAGVKQIAIIEESHREQTTRYVTETDRFSWRTTDVGHSWDGVSGITFVTPFHGITTALTYDEPLNEERSANTTANFTRGVVLTTPNGKVSQTCTSLCSAFGVDVPNVPRYDSSLRVRRWNESLAWQHGPLALGASLRYTQVREDAEIRQLSRFLSGIDDAAWSYRAGLKWDVTHALHAGASYESSATVTGSENHGAIVQKTFKTPATLRAGIAVNVARNLTATADAVRVGYSQLNGGVFNVYLPFNGMQYPNVTEFHAGVEYRLGSVAVRGGWWRDPAHGLQPIGRWSSGDIQLALLENRAENHVTAGFSAGTRTRLDAAIDRGSRSTRVIVGVGASY